MALTVILSSNIESLTEAWKLKYRVLQYMFLQEDKIFHEDFIKYNIIYKIYRLELKFCRSSTSQKMQCGNILKDLPYANSASFRHDCLMRFAKSFSLPKQVILFARNKSKLERTSIDLWRITITHALHSNNIHKK